MVLEETILKYALSLENVSEQDDEKMKILKRGETFENRTSLRL